MMPLGLIHKTAHLGICAFLSLFWINGPAMGQQNSVRFEHFTMEDRMSQNSAHCIFQDSDGFLWIGTQDGLNRYDGYTFEQFHYVPGDSSSLADDNILSLFEDIQKNLWVGTQSGGIHRFEKEKQAFSRFRINNMLTDSLSRNEKFETINVIRQIGKDSLLIGTQAGLILLDSKKGITQNLAQPKIGNIPIQALEIDYQGRVWVGNDSGSVFVSSNVNPNLKNPRIFESLQLSNQSAIQSFHEDKYGNMWIATLGNGIIKYELTSQLSSEASLVNINTSFGLASDSVTAIAVDHLDRLWIGYPQHGLGLKYPNGEYKNFSFDATDNYSLTNNYIHSILIDKTSNLWIGTWNGLNKLSPQFEAITLFSHYEDQDRSHKIQLASVEEDHSGIVWLGTTDGILLTYSPQSHNIFRHPYSIATDHSISSSITDIHEDANNILWVVTLGQGVHTLDKARNPFNYFTENSNKNRINSDESVLSILEVSPGNFWFGTRHNGIKTFYSTSSSWNNFQSGVESPDSLSSNYIWQLLKTQNSEIWIGAHEGGLHRFNPEKNGFDFFPATPNGLTSNRIYSLLEDSRNILWIGTAEGLNKFNRQDSSFTDYQIVEGLPHGRVVSLQEDNQGRLWIATNSGLSRFDPTKNTFKNFYFYDGLQADRFHAGASTKLSDGRLIFGGPGGVNIIDPEKIYVNDVSPAIQFTKLEVNGKLRTYNPAFQNKPESLVLEYNDRLVISFSVLDFNSVRENKYQYKLDDDDDWLDLGTQNFVSFSSLDYGNHTFVVKGQNNEGHSTPELRVPLYVNTPLWRKTWFRSLLGVLLAGVIASFVIVRVRYLLGIERMRLDIAKSLHDDLGGNLSTISIQTGVLQNKTAIGDRERRQLARISNMARETAHKVREAVWLIDAEYDTLDRLVAKIKDLATTMFEGHVACTFTQQPLQMPAKKLKMNFRQNVYYLTKEALNNVNKYAQASNVYVSVLLEKELLTVIIRDDGIGFSNETVKMGNGLKFMRKRAEEVKGELKIDSLPGNGTSISLIVVIP